MKLLRNILLLLLLLPYVTIAQHNKNLTRKEVGRISRKIEGRYAVKQGEFKLDFENRIFDDIYGNNYKYVVVARDRKGDVIAVLMNNYLINFTDSEYSVEIVRAGYTIPECIYYYKREASTVESGSYKYYLTKGETTYGPYDEITEVLPDGFVCKNKDEFTYCSYDSELLDKKKYCILQKDIYKGQYVECKFNGESLKFEPKGNLSYYKNDKHYYLLYNNKLMEHSLLIVDGVGYELNGKENSILFKFSHNGEHWIAAAQNYVLVDGLPTVRANSNINKISINNRGSYAYVVSDGNNNRDKLYFDNDLVVEGVEVVKLTVDNDEKINYMFRNEKGYFYGIDNNVRSMVEDLKNYYLPEVVDEHQIDTVRSNDGKHSFIYSYDWPYVIIDGDRLEFSDMPHYVTWSEKERSFIWNAVEDVKLVVYKYKVKKR